MGCRSVRGSLCSKTPARITNNRTPPPIVSPHITTIKNHLILLHFKFCLANVHSCQYTTRYHFIINLQNFTIMKVTINFVSDSEKFVGRVNINTNESYKQLDEKGVEKDVNQFSMDSFALEMTLREKCAEYRRFALLGNGKLETGEIGMLLMGATAEITRTLKKAGEAREVGEGTYERDTYTTKIDSITINTDPNTGAMIDDLRASIRERKALAKMANANPFGF